MAAMTVCGHARVSAERQADEGMSRGAQERVLRGYALQHRLQLARVFVEQGVSGSTPIASAPKAPSCLRPCAPATWCAHAQARPHVPLRPGRA